MPADQEQPSCNWFKLLKPPVRVPDRGEDGELILVRWSRRWPTAKRLVR
jgi:hypothetical protein